MAGARHLPICSKGNIRVRHPAHSTNYDTLIGGLKAAIADGFVYERQRPSIAVLLHETGRLR